MPGILRAFLFWTLMLCACAPVIPATNTAPQNAPPTIESPIAVTIAAPPNPQECGYQWAQQDLPELSSSFQQSIQLLQPTAKARAFAFGENCVYTDGTATFLAMETDFDVNLQVPDLTDTTALGGWIVNIMQVIEKIPPDQFSGLQPGRVLVVFEQGEERGGLTFYIHQYRDLPMGLSNAEIYQSLQAP